MHKLEQVESFGAFLDFLSNPDEYRQLIKDVRNAAKEHKNLVEKKRKIKDIDEWRVSEEARLSRLETDLNAKVDQHAKRTIEHNERLDKRLESINIANKNLVEREKELDEREDSIQSLEKDRQKVDQLRQEYEAKLENLRQEKDRLKQQAEQIRAAAGGL
jgi:chromosome segregation ATPase